MLLDERAGWLFLLLLFGCNWCYRQHIVVQSSDCIVFAPFLHEPHLVVLHVLAWFMVVVDESDKKDETEEKSTNGETLRTL